MKTIFITLILLVPVIAFSQSAKQFSKTGQTFVKAGNHADAIEQFSKAIALEPDNAELYVERAASYAVLKDYEKALDDYNRAIVFKPKDEELLLRSAEMLFALKRYPEANDMANKSIVIDSKKDESYRLLTQILINRENYSDALIAIDKAILLEADAVNFYWRAKVSEKMKNYKQAEIDFEKAIAGDKKYIDAYLALASLSVTMGNTEKAMANCTKVFELQPESRDALYIRSQIYVKRKEYPKAIDDISKIIYTSSEDKEMYLARGTYYQEFTQHQSAINDFSKAILIDNKYAEAYYNRAYSYEQTGDFKKAIKDYEVLSELSQYDMKAKMHLDEANKRLFELNREAVQPKISLTEPIIFTNSIIKIASNRSDLVIRGKIFDDSELDSLSINGKEVAYLKNGDFFEFIGTADVIGKDTITLVAGDVYNNIQKQEFVLERTEINPPQIAILAPYASDNNEIYLDTKDPNLYIEGSLEDESLIRSVLIDGVSASFMLSEKNPRFTANINLANKNTFTVTVEDIYGNDTSQTFTLNREGASLLDANPMGRTWVIFIENSDYETFPSLEGPSKDVTLMRSAMARYDIHKVIHKKNMKKNEMEKFFSIELRDLLRSNKVNTLLIWYAGHGKFINETGYWIPIDAKRDDEFTYFSLATLKASMQTYTNIVTHTLVINDACESGPTFYQAMRADRQIKNCNDWESVKFKSSQVLSSAGYELAVDNSQFTKTFANTLVNNPDACLPIESIVNKVTVAVGQSNQQTPKFGKIAGLEDEDGTFYFISK